MRKKHLNLNIFKKAAIFYKFIFLKWLIDFKNKFKNFSIKKLINKLKGIPNNDIDSVSNKIDGRGRFDKLMSEGEEKIWLQKFSKIKL